MTDKLDRMYFDQRLLGLAEGMAADAHRYGWRLFVIGGAVRDALQRKLGWDCNTKDLDLEIHGPETVDELKDWLQRFGEVDDVGAQFGVLLVNIHGESVEVSIPTEEAKNEPGHKGLTRTPLKNPTYRQAAERRDYTIDSAGYNPLSGELHDPYGAAEDLRWGILRAVGRLFDTDPLRPLRGMSLASRKHLKMDMLTELACQRIAPEFETLPESRLWTEWEKWAQGQWPMLGLEVLERTGWVHCFPVLSALYFCEQDPSNHPEGTAWEHTKEVCQEMATLCLNSGITGEDRTVLMLAALLHDAGKPKTTRFSALTDTRDQVWVELMGNRRVVVFESGEQLYDDSQDFGYWNDRIKREGRWRSYGHDVAGPEEAEEFLWQIGASKRIAERVLPLVRYHMAFLSWGSGRPSRSTDAKISDRTIRRLALDLHPATIEEWAMLCDADASGRPPLEKGMPRRVSKCLLRSRAIDVNTRKPEPILMGRHLIPMGVKPGPGMGAILRRAFQAQIDGEFGTIEGALDWLETYLAQERGE